MSDVVPVRFSLASLRPLPHGLLTHTRHAFAQFFGHAAETTLRSPLFTRSFTTTAPLPDDLDEVRSRLRGPAIALGVDCALLTGPLAAHGPRMVVTDVDSTFIRGEVIEMLAAAAGTASMVREVTARAMRGELDFAQSLRERVATLSGLPDSVFSDVAAAVELTAGAADTVRAIHTRGGYFGLVSGGFHEVVDRVAEPLGIDKVLANRLEVSKGILTGHTRGPVIDRAAKAEALAAWADEFAIPLEQVVAVGDGANDLDMMRIAGLSVAFCAKPVVLEEADAAITVPRLDMLLTLLGWDTDSAESSSSSSSSTSRDTRTE